MKVIYYIMLGVVVLTLFRYVIGLIKITFGFFKSDKKEDKIDKEFKEKSEQKKKLLDKKYGYDEPKISEEEEVYYLYQKEKEERKADGRWEEDGEELSEELSWMMAYKKYKEMNKKHKKSVKKSGKTKK